MNTWIKTALTAGLLTLAAAGAHAQDANPIVRLETSKGEIRVELFAERAPKTVENFLAYVRDGHYDGTVFHRVIPGFMIQGGGFTSAMEKKPTGPPVVNEAEEAPPNERGTVAMARTRNPDSATSQFFVNVADNKFLNAGERGAGYAVFGRVVEGMEVVDAIAQVETTTKGRYQDVPKEPVVIEEARRVDGADGGADAVDGAKETSGEPGGS